MKTVYKKQCREAGVRYQGSGIRDRVSGIKSTPPAPIPIPCWLLAIPLLAIPFWSYYFSHQQNAKHQTDVIIGNKVICSKVMGSKVGVYILGSNVLIIEDLIEDLSGTHKA